MATSNAPSCPRCGETYPPFYNGYDCSTCGWPVEVHPNSFGALHLRRKQGAEDRYEDTYPEEESGR